MKTNMKFLSALVIATLLTGCNKNGEVEVPNGTNLMNALKISDKPLTGYKEFQFDMAESELLKVPACKSTVKSQEEQLVDLIRGQVTAQPPVTCSIDFMGSTTAMYPKFIDAKLKMITLDLGQFDEDRYIVLANSLADKYNVEASITESQRTAFNNGTIDQVVSVFANGQIGLIIYNEKGVDHHDELGLSLEESMQYATPTINQKMYLQYVAQDQASAMLNLAKVGNQKADDL